MSHEEARALLSEYRDGELPVQERAAVAAHLSACAECRRELAFYERAAAVLPRPKAPTSFETEKFARAVLERLETPRPFLAWRSWRWTVPALAFSAAAAAVSLGVFPRADSDPADELLTAQDGGRTLSWLASPSAAEALGLEER